MLARTTDHLPEGVGWVFEPKWDGFRALADIDGRVVISSRSGARLDRRFPEIADALADAIPAGTTLDGEIVRWNGGRLDFDALLRRGRSSPVSARRLARTEPCHYIVFDLLRIDDKDLTRKSLTVRRGHLERLLDDVPPILMLSWQTADVDEAMDWWSGLADVGVEGLVIKDSRRTYRPGRRDWLKYKHRTTTEAIVGGIIGKTHSARSLILGRYDTDGRLRIAGRTTDLNRRQQEELAEHGLHKAASGHPWPATLAPRWGSRERIAYTRVEPTLVVEIEPDTATTGTAWRHPVRYRRPRPDRTPDDVPTGLDVET